MTGTLSFAVSWPIALAIGIALLQPGILWLLAFTPGLRGRNALQFALSVVAAAGAFLALVVTTSGAGTGGDVAIGALLLFSSNLLLLEIWALLSRGYTLGLLQTLLRSDGMSLTRDELAAQYRAGDSIDWIMRHRLEGLLKTGLVARDGDRLRLTSLLGVPVTLLYLFSVRLLGLRRSG